MRMSRKLAAVAMVLLAATTGAATAGLREAPDATYHSRRAVDNLIVDTSACPGFATTSSLHLAGSIFAAYRRWGSGDVTDTTEAGVSIVNVTAGDGGHRYRITQLFVFPRQYRELVAGWAHARVVRDDGAMMVGDAWLGIETAYPGGPAEGVWWTGTPTCVGPRR